MPLQHHPSSGPPCVSSSCHQAAWIIRTRAFEERLVWSRMDAHLPDGSGAFAFSPACDSHWQNGRQKCKTRLCWHSTNIGPLSANLPPPGQQHARQRSTWHCLCGSPSNAGVNSFKNCSQVVLHHRRSLTFDCPPTPDPHATRAIITILYEADLVKCYRAGNAVPLVHATHLRFLDAGADA